MHHKTAIIGYESDTMTPFIVETAIALILAVGWFGRPTYWWCAIWLVTSLCLIVPLLYSQQITHPDNRTVFYFAERAVIIIWALFGCARISLVWLGRRIEHGD